MCLLRIPMLGSNEKTNKDFEMKKVALAFAFSTFTTAAVAGGMNVAEPDVAPVMPETILQDTASSSGSNLLIPMLAVLILAGVSSN